MFDRSSGYTQLWLSVILQAIYDANYEDGDVQREAVDWLCRSIDFDDACENAGIDPDWALTQLKDRPARAGIAEKQSRGLTPQQMLRLQWLEDQSGWVRAADLQSEFNLTQSTARLYAVRMEKLGYLERETRRGWSEERDHGGGTGTAYMRVTDAGRAALYHGVPEMRWGQSKG